METTFLQHLKMACVESATGSRASMRGREARDIRPYLKVASDGESTIHLHSPTAILQ